MKNCLSLFLTVFIFCCPVILPAQDKPDITGVWTGHIYNDSTKKFLPFELAISRKNGEFSGYSYTIFTIDSVENIGVKEVSISEKNGTVTVKDKKLIDDNYSDRPAKGVHTTIELNYTDNDTAEVLSGKWFTNKTKKFYPLSGTAALSRKKYYKDTRIIQRLRYLGLANSLSFFNPHEADYAVNEVNKNVAKNGDHNAKKDKEDQDMITIMEPEFVIELPRKDSTPKINLPQVGEVAKILESLDSPDAQKSSMNGDLSKSDVGKSGQSERASDINKEVSQEEKIKLNSEINQVQPVAVPVQNKIFPEKKDLSNRKIETIQSVKIFGDSIVLSLFDNGTVDGDTVSVILNGQVIISRVGLLAKAYNHTVHLTSAMGDSIKIVMYAENLGSIPPNTGLLVIRDGGTDHEIRFSGDLQKNSAIILLRNKIQ